MTKGGWETFGAGEQHNPTSRQQAKHTKTQDHCLSDTYSEGWLDHITWTSGITCGSLVDITAILVLPL